MHPDRLKLRKAERVLLRKRQRDDAVFFVIGDSSEVLFQNSLPVLLKSDIQGRYSDCLRQLKGQHRVCASPHLVHLRILKLNSAKFLIPYAGDHYIRQRNKGDLKAAAGDIGAIFQLQRLEAAIQPREVHTDAGVRCV